MNKIQSLIESGTSVSEIVGRSSINESFFRLPKDKKVWDALYTASNSLTSLQKYVTKGNDFKVDEMTTIIKKLQYVLYSAKSFKDEKEVAAHDLFEAKVGGVSLSSSLVRNLKSAGFSLMTDFRGFADAPKGTYILETKGADVTILVSPFLEDGLQIEIYWEGEGQSGTAQWGAKSSQRVLPKIKELKNSLVKVKNFEDFKKITKSYQPDQFGY